MDDLYRSKQQMSLHFMPNETKKKIRMEKEKLDILLEEKIEEESERGMILARSTTEPAQIPS